MAVVMVKKNLGVLADYKLNVYDAAAKWVNAIQGCINRSAESRSWDIKCSTLPCSDPFRRTFRRTVSSFEYNSKRTVAKGNQPQKRTTKMMKSLETKMSDQQRN